MAVMTNICRAAAMPEASPQEADRGVTTGDV
jgi:hypothetical protein